jgi:hypothetical protein
MVFKILTTASLSGGPLIPIDNVQSGVHRPGRPR